MDTKLLLSLLTSLLLLPHGQLSPPTDCGGTVTSINQQYYRKRDDNVSVMPLSTTTTSSTTFCASMCSQQPSCRYFRWSPASTQCSLFRTPTRNETAIVLAGLTEKPRCAGSRTESQKGICHCSNGHYGPNCDQPFVYDLKLIAQIPVYKARDIDQFESAVYGSMITITSFCPYTPGYTSTLFTRCFNCSYGTFSYADHGGEYRFDMLTSAKSFTAFGSSYLFMTTYNNSNSSSPNKPSQMLLDANVPNIPCPIIQSWPDLAVSSATVFKRSTGDVYLCYTVDDVPGSTPGMKVFRFDPATEKFNLELNASDPGPHRQCAILDIDGTLFALSDSPAKNVTTLYSLVGNHTWQPHSNITGPGNLSSLSVAFSTQANTHMLVVSHADSKCISMYLWRNQTFVPSFAGPVGDIIEFPYLIEVGYQMCVLLSYAQPDSNSKLHILMFNATAGTLYLFGSKTGSQPSGGFSHFWFEDNLYLVVLNKFNVVNTTSNVAYNTGNQQVYLVV